MITLSIETLPDLPTSMVTFLRKSEIIITLLFTIEYFLRVFTAPKKYKYIFSFYGIIDIVAILPFYLGLGADLRCIRAFRLFLIFRILKLQRYSKAVQRFTKIIVLVKAEIVLFFGATLVLLYLSAMGIYYFENYVQPEAFKSVFHSLWWAVATLTTVGYGDVYPVTIGGKLFTFAILMIGLGIVAVPAGLISSALSEVLEDEKKNESKKQ